MPELLRGRYELLEVVGHGGEGRVVKALDTQLDRVVALKIRALASDADRDDVLREARILLAVPPHPHLPLVREDFFDGDTYVIAMDWVEGTNLAELVRARGRPGLAPSLVMRWLADAAAALTHLHTQAVPVIHGDVKPANLILGAGGRLSLVDFGLSSSPHAPQRRGGTPGFAAPEVAASGQHTRASDVYSLAATAFALLTGEPPTGIRPRWDEIDRARADALENAIRAAMATDPARRTPTPGEFVEQLRAGWGATLPTGVLTFCMTDIEGSTALWERDLTAMARAVVTHDRIIADAVDAHGGHLLQSMGEGDSTVSVFASPQGALGASIGIMRGLAAADWPAGLSVRARAALHTGEADRRGDSYFGPTLNLTARVRGLADGGQVFVSDTTARLVANDLPQEAALIDLGPHRLKGIDSPVTVFALRAAGVEAPPPPECPYPGLLAFEAEDAARFFGREEVVGELSVRLDRGFIAVIGASGSGKSSLLRAGLGPRQPSTVITPGATPTVPSGHDLLIVDQFEELFTLCEDEGRREAFVDALLSRAEPVVIGLRADFYGQCTAYPELARRVANNQVLLGPMNERELRRAIVEPARAAGLSVEPGLVDLVIADVAGQPGALPMLSHALRATWEVRDGRTLKLDGYRSTGGVRGAIARSGDAVLDTCDDAERAAAKRIFLRLTKPGEGTEDTRRRTQRAELPDDDGVTDRTLERLAHARLVTVDDDTIDLAHEALIREWPTLRMWLDEDREGRRVRQHLADAALAWARSERPVSDLYRGARLASVEGLGELSAVERDFVTASAHQQSREVRRLRGALAGVALALVVALVAGAIALGSRNRASTNARAADVSRLAALSRAVRAEQPDLGLLLATEAFALRDSAETRGALAGALNQNPRLVGVLHGIQSGLESADFSPDGRILATTTFDGTLLWDTVTRQRIGEPLKDEQTMWLSSAFSPDGSQLAVGGERGVISLWDVATRKVARQLHDPDGEGVARVAWSPDGTYLATGGGEEGNRVVVYDSASGEPLGPALTVWEGSRCEMSQPAFSPDGRTLVASGDCGHLSFWRVPTLEPLPKLAVTEDLTANTYDASIAPTKPWVAVGAQNGDVTVFDLVTRQQVGETLSVGDTPAITVAFSPDASLLAAGSSDGETFLWRTDSQELFGEPLSANAGRINAVAFSPDGQTLATASYDRRGALWDLTGRHPLGRPLDAEKWVTSVAYSADGSLLATGYTADDAGSAGGVVIRSAKTLNELRRIEFDAFVLDVAFGPRGHDLAVGLASGSVRWFDGDTGRELPRRIDLDEPAWVSRLAFMRDGRLAVATGPNVAQGFPDPPVPAAVYVFDRDGKVTARLTDPEAGDITDIAFDERQERLVVIGERQATVFDVATRRRIGRPWQISDTTLYAGAISRDGTKVAFGGFSGHLEVRDIRSRRREVPVMTTDPIVFGMRFSRDESMLATTTMYNHTQLFDSRTGEAIGDPLVGGVVPVPDSRFVQFLFPTRNAFSPSGGELATAGIDGSSMVWNVAVGRWKTRACELAGRALTRVEWTRYVGDRAYRPVCQR